MIGRIALFNLSIAIVLILTLSKAHATKFQIAYSDHPSNPTFIPIVREAYAAMGIEVVFQKLPDIRAISEVDKGRYDADLVRTLATATKYDNVIVIPVALAQAEVILVCVKNVPCDQSVLNNKDVFINSMRSAESTLQEHDITIEANLYREHEKNVAVNMLRYGRVDYGLYATDLQLKQKLAKEFQIVTIVTVPIFHVIHQQHKDLLPQLTKELEKIIARQ